MIPHSFLFTYKAMSTPIFDTTPMEKQIYIFCLQFIFPHFLWNKFQKYFIPIPSGKALFKVTNDFTSQGIMVSVIIPSSNSIIGHKSITTYFLKCCLYLVSRTSLCRVSLSFPSALRIVSSWVVLLNLLKKKSF